jgi:acyl-CoA thioesterase-1
LVVEKVLGGKKHSGVFEQPSAKRGVDFAHGNAAAVSVMKEEGVEINDLHAFAAPRMADIGKPANVHYTPQGSQTLAGEVARRIEAALPRVR